MPHLEGTAHLIRVIDLFNCLEKHNWNYSLVTETETVGFTLGEILFNSITGVLPQFYPTFFPDCFTILDSADTQVPG